MEPKEAALSILLPAGWIAEGGVVRIDPRLGPTNSVGAKIDVTVKKDRAGSIKIHWLPNFTYQDPRPLMGLFRVGSNYMGSMERKPLPELAQRYQQRAPAPSP